jgi:hypothetical protein
MAKEKGTVFFIREQEEGRKRKHTKILAMYIQLRISVGE